MRTGQRRKPDLFWPLAIPDAYMRPRTMLIPGILDIFRKVNVSELQNTVDAVKSLPMPGFIAGPEDCD